MKKRNLILLLILTATVLTQTAFARPANINEKLILKNIPNLDPTTLKYAVKGYKWATRHTQVNRPDTLTIIDFSKPSSQKRLWVINLKTSKLLLNTFTTHGSKSGALMAKSFSNKVDTDKTSLGVYKTLHAYTGQHGYSLRIQGLEKGINDNALKRNVVIHPAWYATPKFVKQHHLTGRSWGCFALDPAISSKVINHVKDGSIIFAYAAPEKHDHYLASV